MCRWRWNCCSCSNIATVTRNLVSKHLKDVSKIFLHILSNHTSNDKTAVVEIVTASQCWPNQAHPDSPREVPGQVPEAAAAWALATTTPLQGAGGGHASALLLCLCPAQRQVRPGQGPPPPALTTSTKGQGQLYSHTCSACGEKATLAAVSKTACSSRK